MKKFELTENHVKLLQRMYIDWDDSEFGAPEVDPKRPYGNSDVHKDMLNILGWTPECALVINGKSHKMGYVDLDYNGWTLPREIITLLDELHAETQTALQIILVTKSFIPGIYECGDHTGNWRLVDGAK